MAVEEFLIERYEEELTRRDAWQLSDLAEFFEVSHETIRNCIENETIQPRKKETEDGHYWEISSEEVRQAIREEQQLQRYLTSKLQNEANGTDKNGAVNGSKNGDDSAGNTVVAALLKRLDAVEERNERLQETISDLGDVTGQLWEERNRLQQRREALEAELESRPSPHALEAALHEGYEKALEHVGWWSSILEKLLRQQLPDGETNGSAEVRKLDDHTEFEAVEAGGSTELARARAEVSGAPGTNGSTV